jgi:glycosyltransferase involved in cell wall biosynthesis
LINNKVKNVELIDKNYDRSDYINFLKSLNSYVLISKGEGFSISPREAMALGIPCILSNNTTHKTICDSGLALPVTSEILEPADYTPFFGKFCGDLHNCLLKDVREALREMYNNYSVYDKTHHLKKWAAQYSYDNLKPMYLSLVKPKKILLGSENLIKKDCVITNSLDLFKKYNQLIKNESMK